LFGIQTNHANLNKTFANSFLAVDGINTLLRPPIVKTIVKYTIHHEARTLISVQRMLFKHI